MPEDNLSLEFVKCRLLDEEVKRRGIGVESFSQDDGAAFSGSKQQFKKKIKCYGCKKEGHKQVDCPEKKKSSRKPQQNSKANFSAASDNSVCFVGVSGGVESRSGHRVRWYLDSGASDHLVNDRKLFTELRPLEEPVEIAVAKDGETIVAKHSGTVKVVSVIGDKTIDCTIKEVLYVPKLRCNLFSVVKVERAGMKIVFEAGKAKIYRDSEIVACAERRDKLYELQFQSVGHSASSLLTCGRVRKDLELWHRRFGHLSDKSLEELMRNDMVSGLPRKNSSMKNNTVACEPCIAGKQTRKPFSVGEGRRSSRVLERVHTDVCGPVTPVGLNGAKYFVTFVDDWSHFTMVYLMESKDQVLEYFRQYEALATAKFGVKIATLRCDNGGEYRSKEFERFCKKKGIQVEWTVPYTPEQNGVSERMNRTLVEKTRAMLEDCGIDKRFWGQAVQTAAFLTNRSPTSAVDVKKTPFELWESKKPDVSKLRAFGSKVFVHLPKEHRTKLDAKTWKGIFVGYSHNGYRIWDPVKKRIIIARDVDFVETGECSGRNIDGGITDDYFRVRKPEDDHEEATDAAEAAEEENDEYLGHSTSEEEEYNSTVEDDEADESGDERTGEGRPQRKRAAPIWHKDFEMECAGFALNAMSFVDNIPSTIAELKKRDDWPQWKIAIDEEMDSLKRNNTWTLAKLPKGRSAVTCKWVFSIKRGVDGQPDRYKARLVARGFSQKPGFDYTETYSPVAKLDTLRAVLAIANQDRMHIHQMDVKTAFLNGELQEEIYMVQPDGFQQGKELYCRLNRSLYGLKQSSRAWNDKFHKFIEKLGFVRSANDQCLYVRGKGLEKVILVLYVDDILLACSSMKVLETVKRLLSREYEMKDIGDIKHFLGMKVERNLKEGRMKISQRNYLEELLRRFEMFECKPISTPMENKLRLRKGVEELRTTKPYRELIGCLMYASLTTRPDISATVNYFSQFQSCPNEVHWVQLKRVLRYIKGSLEVGLVYQVDADVPVLMVYSDADWANDLVDRRSVTGCVFKLFGCTVGWITRKQQTVSLSSTEAELSALCTAACHAIWMIRLLGDLGKKPTVPVQLFEDNQSTIRIAEDSRDYGRLKHVDTKFHFLRDLVQQGTIQINYVRTTEQQADIMTKGLPKNTFRQMCSKIGLDGCCV
ncbi:hypothetical protein RP20_CCG000687 [Aedes albopictus]|nr:hypothetical protein RP20_CCG000687 [Aedes albopictus]